MSTYTENLLIEKPLTGSQQGQWGNTVNTNFDIIDQGINGIAGVVLGSAGTSGSPNTLPITLGAMSDGRNKFIEFTDGGDLGATAYVQLTPNTAEKVVHVRNSLSGGQVLVLFQGNYDAGRSFELANGLDAVIKFDGGGAVATVENVFVNLSADAVTLTSATVENNTTTGGLIVTTAQGNVTVPATGSSLDFARAGSSYIRATDAAGNFRFITGANDFTSTRLFLANNGDVSFFEATGVTAKLFWDASAESLDVANAMYSQFFAGIADRNTYWAIDGTDEIRAVTGGTQRMVINASGRLGIGTNNPSDLLDISANGTSAMRLSDSSSPATYAKFTQANGVLTLAADAANAQTASNIQFEVDATERMRITDTGNVGIGTSTPGVNLDVVASGNAGARIESTGAGTQSNLYFADANTTSNTSTRIGSAGDAFRVFTNSTERVRVDASGNVGIGTSIPATNLHVSDATEAQIYLSDTGGAGATSANSQLVFTHGAGNTNNAYIGNDQAVVTGAFSMGTLVNYPIAFVINSSEAMRLTTSGYLGIGTDGPSDLLHIEAATPIVRLSETDDTAYSRIFQSAGDLFLAADVGNDGGSNIVFRNGGTTERVRIDNSGNVGIGTDNPSTKLHLTETGGPEIRLSDTETTASGGERIGTIRFNTADASPDATDAIIYGELADAFGRTEICFGTNSTGNPTERMRIDLDGNVGIGTTSPATALQVVGVVTTSGATPSYNLNDADGGAHRFASANSSLSIEADTGDAGGSMNFLVGTEERMRIGPTGNVGIGTDNPSTKLHVNTGANGEIARFQGLDAQLVINNTTSNVIDFNSIGGGDTITFSVAGGTEAARIESSGKVGIGVSTALGGILTLPHQESISFHDAGGAARRVLEFDTGELKHGSAGAGLATQIFYTNGIERMRIDASGRIALGNVADSDAGLSTIDAVTIIGKSIGGGYSSSIRFECNDEFGPTLPGKIACVDTFGGGGSYSPFDSAGQMQITALAGGVLLADASLVVNGYPKGAVHLSGGITKAYRRTTTTSDPVFQVASDVGGALTTKWQVTANGTAATTSDQRLKENIVDAADAGSAIDAMQVRQFDWKGTNESQSYGFVAQELNTVFPEAVVEGGANESTDPWGVDYAALVPMLVKEIQSLRARVAQLEAN